MLTVKDIIADVLCKSVTCVCPYWVTVFDTSQTWLTYITASRKKYQFRKKSLFRETCR